MKNRVRALTVWCFSWLLALCSVSAATRQDAPFKDGDRVCFFGDSVTHGGKYTSQVQLFYYTRYPERDIRIWNCGTGGATSGESLVAVDDIASRKPTHVVVLFGMNDCNLDFYLPTAPEWMVAFRPKLLERFKANYPALHRKTAAAAPGASFTFCTLVPWDDELKFRGARANEKPPAGITADEKAYADFVRDYHAEVGGGFVDFYTPMLAWNRRQRKTDPYYSLTPDRIHPKEPGGLFMAALFLRSQGVSGVVSDVVIDAGSGRCTRKENAEITALGKTAGGGVTFVSQEKALPFPVNPKAAELAGQIGFNEEFNRQYLSVVNLPPGQWKLVIDGSNAVCSASSEEWAKGVNLAEHPTPMMKQALAVAETNSNRMWAEWNMRGLFVSRNILWRRLQSIDPKLYTEKDLDDPKIYKAFCRGAVEGTEKSMRKDSRWKKMLDDWHKRDKMLASVEILHQRVRAGNRPVPHVFTLTRDE